MQETQPGPIRIKLITQLEGSYLDEAAKKRLAEQLAPGAVNIITKYVQVRLPRKYSIRMPKPSPGSKEGMCNDAYAAPLWEDGGIRGHDLVLFVTANATKDCKQGALAYTLPCLTDMVTGRPTAAGLNICPLSQRSSPPRLLNTLVHELVHALVSTRLGVSKTLSLSETNQSCPILACVPSEGLILRVHCDAAQAAT